MPRTEPSVTHRYTNAIPSRGRGHGRHGEWTMRIDPGGDGWGGTDPQWRDDDADPAVTDEGRRMTTGIIRTKHEAVGGRRHLGRDRHGQQNADDRRDEPNAASHGCAGVPAPPKS